jgi:3-hydroxybutyryl-CoA dehydrogenase
MPLGARHTANIEDKMRSERSKGSAENLYSTGFGLSSGNSPRWRVCFLNDHGRSTQKTCADYQHPFRSSLPNLHLRPLHDGDRLKRFRERSLQRIKVGITVEIKKVGVIGAGTMGNGIAHVFARSGFSVVLCDVERQFLERGLATISKNLDREVAKNKITTAGRDAAFARIAGVTDRDRLAECDFILEAATEKLEVKTEIFRDLDRLARPEVILASNTSSISITKLGALTQRPGKVIGMHFFNPVPLMKLVEVIRGLATSQDTLESVREVAERLDKTPLEVADAPGFVSNRVLMPMLNEAMYAVMEGVATPEAVDQVFMLGLAHPMGPLTLADFIGLDVCLDIMRVMLDGLGDPKYRPCPLLIKMVDAGWLGRKSGRGFFKY